MCSPSASGSNDGVFLLQTLQQNSELRQRLQRIHTESAAFNSITESTLVPSSYKDDSLQMSLQTSNRKASVTFSINCIHDKSCFTALLYIIYYISGMPGNVMESDIC